MGVAPSQGCDYRCRGTLLLSVVGLKFLGGEFIPSLDEGDFAVEMSMAQGTSLSQMVETCTKAEKS